MTTAIMKQGCNDKKTIIVDENESIKQLLEDANWNVYIENVFSNGISGHISINGYPIDAADLEKPINEIDNGPYIVTWFHKT